MFKLRDLAGIRTEKRIVLHLVPNDLGDSDGSQLGKIPANFDAIPLPQVFLGDRASRHPHGCLPRGGTPPPAIVAKTVFHVVGVIGMRRSELLRDIAIILRPLINVLDEQSNRRARGSALEHTGENLHLIGLTPLGRMPGFSGTPPIQILLKIGLG